MVLAPQLGTVGFEHDHIEICIQAAFGPGRKGQALSGLHLATSLDWNYDSSQNPTGKPGDWFGTRWRTKHMHDAVRIIKKYTEEGALAIWVQMYTDNEMRDSDYSLILTEYCYLLQPSGEYKVCHYRTNGGTEPCENNPLPNLFKNYEPSLDSIDQWLHTEFARFNWNASKEEPLTFP